MTLNIRGELIDLSTQKVMGILNVTPDSFYDGGYYNSVEQIKNQIKKLKQINHNIIENLKKKNLKKVFYFDNLFHQTLAIQAKMPISWQIISQINTQIDRVRNISYMHEDDNIFGPVQAIKDHQEIVKYLSFKNKLKVVQSMKKHISSLEQYTDFIKKTKKYKDIID